LQRVKDEIDAPTSSGHVAQSKQPSNTYPSLLEILPQKRIAKEFVFEPVLT